MYADDVQLYTSTPKENIDSCLDYNNRNLVRLICINLFKFKCIMLSRTDRSFVIPELSIRENNINFVESAINLDIVFNGR